nr:MAG TPA: BRO family protein [Caudoviricetes sp.]
MDYLFFFFFYDEENQTTAEIKAEDLKLDFNIGDYELFNDKVRTLWHKQEEKFYFSVVDVVQVLTDSKNPTTYWRVLKKRLKDEGNESVTNCNALKLKSPDGKMRLTDVADMQGILRIIQSIPSPKAEPFKMWLAQLGQERIDEIIDPQIAIDRAVAYYSQKGYSDKWIAQRLRGIEARKELTNEWQRAGATDNQYAILTDILTKAWSGMTTRQYKDFKGLKKENLRDNMTNTELALNFLAEVATTELSQKENPKGFAEASTITKKGGDIAGNARKELEQALGRKVVSPANANDLELLDKE